MKLDKLILKTVREENLIPNDGTVLCAVSGGADSTALLHALLSLSRKLKITLAAAHFNHMLRGAESDRDERFVRDLCARLGVRLFKGQGDISRQAKERRIGIEECARDARYTFFREIIEENGIKYLATAHTAKDNLETALFNLARGTAVSGIAGIPPLRQEEGFTLIRPLIRASREDVEDYLREIGEGYVVDSSNFGGLYSRNIIRHGVLPSLEKINPSLYRTSAVTQKMLRQDADFIERTADHEYARLYRAGALGVRALTALHPAIAGRVVLRIYRGLNPDGPEPAAANLTAVLDIARSANPSARAELPGGVSVRREYDLLYFGKHGYDKKPALVTRVLEIGKTTVIKEAGIEITCGFAQSLLHSFRSINNFFFDYSKIYGILSVRARESGDFIRLAGHEGGKTLKRLMIDAKIPRNSRELIPVICDDRGLVAVVGIGVDERVAVTPETNEILTLEIKNI